MFLVQFLVLFIFTTLAVSKHCQNFTVPVDISARNAIYNIPTFQDNLGATTFIKELTKIASPLQPTGYQAVTGTYNISVAICQPNNATGSNSTLQFPVHSLGVDKTYWDLSFNDYNCSYVDVAVDQYGYSALSIDHLEVSVVNELTRKLRAGTLPQVPHRFSKIVHVGWSLGSTLVYSLVVQHPEASDGIILTGFSPDVSHIPAVIVGFNCQLASPNQNLRFGNQSYAAVAQASQIVGAANNLMPYIAGKQPQLGLTLSKVGIAVQNLIFGNLAAGFQGSVLPTTLNLPNNYLTWADMSALQSVYMYPSAFDPALLQYLEANEQPLSPRELLASGTGNNNAPDFKGTVLVVTLSVFLEPFSRVCAFGLRGLDYDAPYCGGACLATGSPNDVEKVSAAFPAAKAFQAYVRPDAGHALNFHYNSTGAYKVIHEFLRAQKLGSS